MIQQSHHKIRRLGAVLLSLLFIIPHIAQAQALVLFQDDTFGDVMSDTVRIGSNDAGAVNTSIQFGNDVTPSENGNITWNISSNSFNFDHSVTITGGLDAFGAVDFSGSTQFRIRQDSDPNTNADCTAVGELIFNETSNQLMRCTSTGTPGVWTNVDTTGGSSDFEAVYTNDADKVLTTSNGIFTINTGTNDFVVDSNDWNVTAAGDLNTVGIASTGTVNFSAASAQRMRESVNPTTSAACTTVNEVIINTTVNRFEICTVPGGAGSATWIAAAAGDASTFGGFTTGQFLRSDTSDTFTSGTLTIDNGTTLAVAGTANIGDGGDDVFIDSNDWSISSAGVAAGFTGVTSTGSIDFSAASAFRIRENANPTTSAACTTANELIVNTTLNRIEICTVPGAAGAATWIVPVAGDAGTLDTIDSTQFLRSDTSDNFTTGTLTTDSGTTFTVNGVANIGDDGDTVTINSSIWDITSTGIATGLTGITSSGAISLGNNTGTVVFDGTNFDVTSAGVVTLTGNLALSGDANEGVSGGGLVDCDSAAGRLQWDATTNKFSCLTSSGPDTASFVDTTPTTPFTDSNTTALFNDATKPNITTDTTSSTVLVSFVFRGTATDADDEIYAVYIARTTDGTDPVCGTSAQVGQVVTSGFNTIVPYPWTAQGTFIDSPGVAGQIRYQLCTSSASDSNGDLDSTMNVIEFSLVELGN